MGEPVSSRTKSQQAQLARYAFDQHWWDLSVQATIAGKLWDQLEERFRWRTTICSRVTLAAKIFRRATRWRLRVRRAPEPESAFTGRRQWLDADYAGHRDAYRQHVQHPGYSGPSQLLDPATNINIGTSYLQYVYQQFGNNRIYASAAYNAGPGRVRTGQ